MRGRRPDQIQTKRAKRLERTAGRLRIPVALLAYRGDEMTRQEVAVALGWSEEYVRQLESRGLRKMREAYSALARET